jgi:hypothetical protein
MQQTARQQRIAILVAFTLVDTDQHATWITLDVGDLEPDHFGDPQSGRVSRHQ